MNWHAMLQMTAAIAVSCLIAGISIWLMERRNVHPAWILAAIFAAAIIAVGVA